MLNPSVQNFQVQFSDEFFPKEIVQKYSDYLFNINHPFKTWESCFIESIQAVQIGGINIQPLIINGLDNTGVDPRNEGLNKPWGFPHVTNNVAFEGNEPWWNVQENMMFTITLRNNIMNWMYCYELAYRRYLRENRVDLFTFVLKMMDSAEVDMIRMTFSNCFITTLPPLEFSALTTFNESKQIDIGIQANKVDVDFNIPDFKKTNIIL